MTEPQTGDIVLLRSFDVQVPAILLVPQRNGSWLLRVFGRAPNLDDWFTADQGDGPGQWQPRDSATAPSAVAESLLWSDIERAAADLSGEVRVYVGGKLISGTLARAFLADRPQRPAAHPDVHGEPPERCPASADQRGQHIRCDGRFDHAGAQHFNRQHELVWSNGPDLNPTPVDVQARITALSRRLGDTPHRLERRHPGSPWMVSILAGGFAALRVECQPTGYDLFDVGRQFYLASKVDLDTLVREITKALADRVSDYDELVHLRGQLAP